MLKHIYRIIILLGVFVASLYFFGRDIKEVTFDVDNTVEMEEATFPVVAIGTGEDTINLLRGYSSNLNANAVRESVTPLNENQDLEVIINQENYIIKKLNYEIRESVGNELIESNSVSVFTEEGEHLTARISFDEELELGKEYALKITLITSESKKMYYYNRVKRLDDVYLNETLSYIKDFHNAIKDKETAQEITAYLEPDSRLADNASLSEVNIHSSLDLITWGELNPEFITEIVPSVIEIYPNIAFVVLDYFIEADISENQEIYKVKEFYRVRYTPDRMFLLNYERTMESVFDVNLSSGLQNELKLGISSQYEMPYLISSDNIKLAFVRNREIWFCNMIDNEMIKVFSFRQEDTDYIRDVYDQHNLRLLNMDEEGNINFIVYGYMNRGHYEGRVGIILYEYFHGDNRIQEKAFIPIDESYDMLKENLGELTYVNELDVFYFHVYNNIYAYDMITQELTILGENIHDDNIVILNDINHVAWQVSSDPRLSDEIKIMNLETGEIEAVTSPTGYNIKLLDKIDTNIVYGYALESDIETLLDGRVVVPLRNVEISSTDKNILKEYYNQGYYVSSVSVDDNIIELDLIQIGRENGLTTFTEAGKDHIMNQRLSKAPAIEVTTKTTDKAMTELYLKLPSGFSTEQSPTISSTVNTVLVEDPTLRLPMIEHRNMYYYPYLFDGIYGAYEEAYMAIDIARDNVGVVLDRDNRIVWERGVRQNSYVINGFEGMSWNQTSNRGIETCIKLLLQHQGINRSIDELRVDDQSIMDVLHEHSEFAPIRLTDVTLDDVLYSVYKGKPVIAMKSNSEAVLIYGYDNFNIMIIDPSETSTTRIGLNVGADLFDSVGNVFISYN